MIILSMLLYEIYRVAHSKSPLYSLTLLLLYNNCFSIRIRAVAVVFCHSSPKTSVIAMPRWSLKMIIGTLKMIFSALRMILGTLKIFISALRMILGTLKIFISALRMILGTLKMIMWTLKMIL